MVAGMVSDEDVAAAGVAAVNSKLWWLTVEGAVRATSVEGRVLHLLGGGMWWLSCDCATEKTTKVTSADYSWSSWNAGTNFNS